MPRKAAQDKTPTIGDNSVNAKALKAFVERVETVNSEIQTWTGDRKEIFGEVKAAGYDVKQLRRIIKARAADQEKRKEEEAIYDLYAKALGLWS
jgi:uncharacterized protein (UPF0335 family)